MLSYLRFPLPKLLLLALFLLPSGAALAQTLDYGRSPEPFCNHLNCGHQWVELTTDHLYAKGPTGEEDLLPIFGPTLALLVHVKHTCQGSVFTFELPDGSRGYLELPTEYDYTHLWHPASDEDIRQVFITF